MIKYIITWALIKWVSVPCPDAAFTVDEFGRTILLRPYMCAVSHSERQVERRAVVFYNRDSAMAFYGLAISEKIDSVKIDSAVVKTRKK